jgi:hypothetical protein
MVTILSLGLKEGRFVVHSYGNVGCTQLKEGLSV